MENVSETVLEQLVREPSELQGSRSPAPIVTSQILGLQKVGDRSIAAANSMVDGMIAQDMSDFDASSLHFSVAFQPMFPEYDSQTILKASQAYVSALFAQSKLKDDKSLSKEETLHDERWGFVRKELWRMCELLNLPHSFGNETTDFLRYHSIRDDVYIKHLLEAHRVLMKRISGSENFYREIAALYLAAVAFHDRHDRAGVLLGRQIMRTYYDIIFEAVNKSQRR